MTKVKIKVNNLNWKIGGQAGYGILSAGEVFAFACMRGGLETFAYLEYPSLIRGGHNTYQVWVREDNVQSHSDKIDLLVALNNETVQKHYQEVVSGGAIIYDTNDKFLEGLLCPRSDIKCLGIPLQSVAEKSGGQKVMSNMVAVAASLALVKFPFDLLIEFIHRAFIKKGQQVADLNVEAARAGYDYINEHFPDAIDYELKTKKIAPKRMLVNGNEAIALGALQAGVKFMAAYPMTPASSILHYLAAQEKDYSLVVKQTEDELSAINMICGAGFAGVRAMTATSGGGFALMAEGLGLAGMTETPCVIALAQRPGPATGLPTWTEQADLRFALHAGQGDFPRVILAPGDPEECFYLTFEAFNVADKFQLPVMILTDKYLAEARQTLPQFDTSDLKIDRGEYADITANKDIRYERYKDTVSGVSPRTIPGQVGGVFLANSDEHDTTGLSNEDSNIRVMMVNKRNRKLQGVRNYIKEPIKLHGKEKADITLIGWGSTKGVVLEAMKVLEEQGKKVNFLQIKLIEPFPVKEVDAILRQAKHRILIENNSSAQLGGLIREKTGIDITDKLLKFDGRPLNPDEIIKHLNNH